MKKNLFWKIMAVLFFLLLCVCLWRWEGKGRYQIANANIGWYAWRIDTRTGVVDILTYTIGEKGEGLTLKDTYPKK